MAIRRMLRRNWSSIKSTELLSTISITPVKFQHIIAMINKSRLQVSCTQHIQQQNRILCFGTVTATYLFPVPSEVGQKHNNYPRDVCSVQFYAVTSQAQAVKLINSVVSLDAGVMLKSVHPSICVPLTLSFTQPHPPPQPVLL